MTKFSYKARDKEGGLVNASMEAANKEAVIQELDSMGYAVIEISGGGATLDSMLERLKPMNRRDIILFTRQLATLLRAGTPLAPSLATICEQTQNKKLNAILEDVCGAVQKGDSFSSALARHPEAFSDLFISMVQVGEAGGLLDKVLDRLAMLGTEEMDMQSKIVSALIYPLVLVIVAFVVINFLIIGVLPKFVTVFSASGANLPLPTKVVLGLSWTMRRLWLPIVILTVILLAWFRRQLKIEKFKEGFDRLMLKIPIFGELYAKIQISRFSRVTSSLIASGIPIMQALDAVEKTVTNLAIRHAVKDIRKAISEGHSLVEPFKASGLFNPLVVQMIATGEKSGNLDQMLREIASFYEPEIEYTIKNMTSLLEPFMLLVMGAMVAFIALSVLLPIFNLIKVFRG